MKNNKKTFTCLVAASLMVSSIGLASAESLKNGYSQGLKNGMVNGAVNGYVDGLKASLKDGAKEGLKNGGVNGLKDGLKDGAKESLKNGGVNGLKDGLKDGLKNGLADGTKKESFLSRHGDSISGAHPCPRALFICIFSEPQNQFAGFSINF